MARKAQINLYTALKDAGFRKAEKGLKNLRFHADGLNNTLLKLGSGVVLADFARKSIAAAVAMETANAKLGVSLTSIGKLSALGGDSIKKTSTDMANLGFTGANTAEALANLITVTGSLEKAQSLMGASADAARFLHTDLADAAHSLGSAYGGSAKALQVFNIKLDKTLKPAQAFDKAMGMLNAKLSGQAAAYASTYAGKMEILRAKFDQVQIQVGEKLLPKLVKLGDWLINTGVPNLETFFTFIGNNIETVSGLAAALTTVALAFKSIATYADLAKVAALPIMGAAAPFVAAIAAVMGLAVYAQPKIKQNQKTIAQANLSYDTVSGTYRDRTTGANVSQKEADRRLQPQTFKNRSNYPNPMGQTFGQPLQVNRQGVQAAKDAAAAAKAAAALAKKEAAAKLAAQRIVNADKRLAAQFDLNQIALANALKLNLTDKEKAAVQGLIALQDDGYKTEAQRMLDQEAALRKLISLRTDLASIPFYSPTLAGQEKQLSTPQTAASIGTNAIVTGMPGLQDVATAQIIGKATGTQTMTSTPATTPQITINVAGSILKEQELIALIQNGTQLSSLSGSPSQIGRISGMFG
jgi:hypothetical protein